MEVKQTPVAAKVAGRIANIYVKEGDEISVGTAWLIWIAQINAKVEEAQARKELAKANWTKPTMAQDRKEIEMAKYQYDAAQSAADLAKVTYERINRLAAEGWCRGKNVTKPIPTMSPVLIKPKLPKPNMS